jgi:hypothetical protein
MAKELASISFVQPTIINWPQNQTKPMRKITLGFVLSQDLGFRRMLSLQGNRINDRQNKLVLMEQTI